MKIAVLGSTGPSGQSLITQALEDGHHVIALARNPEKLTIKNENLEVREVDIFSEESLCNNLSGCDAVLSCLGSPISFFSEIRLCRDSIKPITSALKTAAITKFVCMSGICARNNPDNPLVIEWLFKPLVVGRNFADFVEMEDYLVNNCQDIKFTVVKPPELQNKPLAEEELVAVEGDYNPQIRWTIPRANVTRFMLDCLTSDTWNNKLVTIGIKCE